MQFRKWTLVFLAVAMLVAAGVGAVMAAPPAQEANGDPVEEQGTSSERVRPYLGIAVAPLTMRAREALEIPEDVEGVVVRGVRDEGPGHDAGLHRGDVITTADGVAVPTVRAFREILQGLQPGDTLDLTVIREGEIEEITVTVGEAPRRHRPDRPDRPQDRPNQLPAWLTQLLRFVRTYPNLVDGQLRLLNAEHEVVTYDVTVGTVTGTGENVVGVQKRDDTAVRFRLAEDSVVLKGLRRVELSDLEEGDHVIVLEQDGVVKAVVAAPFRRVRPKPEEAPGNVDESVLQQLKRLWNASVEADHRLQEQLEAIERHIQAIEERLERLEQNQPVLQGQLS